MMHILGFRGGKFVGETTMDKFSEFFHGKDMVWVDIDTGTDEEFDFISRTFDIHPLTIEDMKTKSSVPKIDTLQDKYMFVTFFGMQYNRQMKKIKFNEIDFVVGRNFLVTSHASHHDGIDGYRQKVMAGGVKIRSGTDSLFHNIMDMEVDKFSQIVNDLTEEVESLEDRLIKGDTRNVLRQLTNHRKQVSELRKVMNPERDIINKISRGESPFVSKSMLLYFRDVYDHMLRFYLSLESHRDILASAFEIYTSVQSNSINQVIKQLTIIATIFLPLTFITGVYGMNFDVMPELRFEYGYYLTLAAMAALGIWMWIYFKKRY